MLAFVILLAGLSFNIHIAQGMYNQGFEIFDFCLPFY
jgi:hypothetical protein